MNRLPPRPAPAPVAPVDRADPAGGNGSDPAAVPGDSRLGPQTRFEGEVSGRGPFRIQGRLRGTIKVRGGIRIEPGGFAEAEIDTDDAVLAGHGVGRMLASGRVHVEVTGSFEGEVDAGRLQVEPGGVVHGRVRVRNR